MKIGRGGFTIVEVVVAIVILAIAAFGIAGVAATASRMLARATATERAAAAAVFVMDSLLAEDQLRAGSRAVGRFDVDWTVQDTGGVRKIKLTVAFREPGRSRERRIAFMALQAPALPRVPAAPAADEAAS